MEGRETAQKNDLGMLIVRLEAELDIAKKKTRKKSLINDMAVESMMAGLNGDDRNKRKSLEQLYLSQTDRNYMTSDESVEMIVASGVIQSEITIKTNLIKDLRTVTINGHRPLFRKDEVIEYIKGFHDTTNSPDVIRIGMHNSRKPDYYSIPIKQRQYLKNAMEKLDIENTDPKTIDNIKDRIALLAQSFTPDIRLMNRIITEEYSKVKNRPYLMTKEIIAEVIRQRPEIKESKARSILNSRYEPIGLNRRAHFYEASAIDYILEVIDRRAINYTPKRDGRVERISEKKAEDSESLAMDIETRLKSYHFLTEKQAKTMLPYALNTVSTKKWKKEAIKNDETIGSIIAKLYRKFDDREYLFTDEIAQEVISRCPGANPHTLKNKILNHDHIAISSKNRIFRKSLVDIMIHEMQNLRWSKNSVKHHIRGYSDEVIDANAGSQETQLSEDNYSKDADIGSVIKNDEGANIRESIQPSQTMAAHKSDTFKQIKIPLASSTEEIDNDSTALLLSQTEDKYETVTINRLNNSLPRLNDDQKKWLEAKTTSLLDRKGHITKEQYSQIVKEAYSKIPAEEREIFLKDDALEMLKTAMPIAFPKRLKQLLEDKVTPDLAIGGSRFYTTDTLLGAIRSYGAPRHDEVITQIPKGEARPKIANYLYDTMHRGGHYMPNDVLTSVLKINASEAARVRKVFSVADRLIHDRGITALNYNQLRSLYGMMRRFDNSDDTPPLAEIPGMSDHKQIGFHKTVELLYNLPENNLEVMNNALDYAKYVGNQE